MAETVFQGVIDASAALAELGSLDAEAPASGAIAALVAAWAGGLAATAADASRAEWPEAAGARAQAQALRRRALRLAEQDFELYARARARLDARGRADPDKAREETRDWQLGQAVEDAAGPPLELARCARDIAVLGQAVTAHGAGDVRAEAAVAAVLASGAARACAHLVEINLVVGGDRDPAVEARTLAEEAAEAATKATALG